MNRMENHSAPTNPEYPVHPCPILSEKIDDSRRGAEAQRNPVNPVILVRQRRRLGSKMSCRRIDRACGSTKLATKFTTKIDDNNLCASAGDGTGAPTSQSKSGSLSKSRGEGIGWTLRCSYGKRRFRFRFRGLRGTCNCNRSVAGA